MIRVLLVDDESRVRSAILRMVDWKALHMDVREAGNGEEALQLAAEFKPHLMIVDMQMPVVDGIELMNRLSGSLCEFVVVSGYDDFRYMKSAIAHKVVDYLLKPISRKEINDALAKAVAAIEARMRKDEDSRIADRLERLLWKDPRLMERTHAWAIEATDPAGWRAVRLTVVYCTDFAAVASRSRNDDRQLLHYQTDRALWRLQGGDDVYLAAGQSGLMEFVVVVKAAHTNGEGESRAIAPESLSCRLSEAIGVESVVFSCVVPDGLQSLRRTYAGIRHAFVERLWANPALAADESGARTVDAAPSTADLRRICREAGLLSRQGQFTEIRGKIGDWIAALERMPQLKITHAFSLYTELRSALLDGLYFLVDKPTVQSVLPHWRLDDFLEFGLHPDSLLASLEEDAGVIAAFADENKPQFGIDAVTQFIRERFSETYSLDELAAHFHFSKSYLCKVFKEKHGCTITDYVTKLRMENARVYIVEKGLQVNQASEMVGIRDFSYFSKLYKKHFGYPPSSEAR